MEGLVVDTDVLIDFLRTGEENPGTELGTHISAITAFELLRGAAKFRGKHLVRTRRLIASFRVLTYTEATAAIAADIITGLERQGRPIPNEDLFIAATAVETGLPLHTRNTRHFLDIEGLELDEAGQ